jgi:excisionase family DNA binding protein
MASALYSADEVADLLGLHVRTVRGYVRDGRLPAVRIGKQYRISEDDLRTLTGGHEPAPAPRVEVSAVVQIDTASRHVMDRVSTHVVAAANTGSGTGSQLHVQTVYDEARQTLKVIIVGDADAVARTITLISALTCAGPS